MFMVVALRVYVISTRALGFSRCGRRAHHTTFDAVGFWVGPRRPLYVGLLCTPHFLEHLLQDMHEEDYFPFFGSPADTEGPQTATQETVRLQRRSPGGSRPRYLHVKP